MVGKPLGLQQELWVLGGLAGLPRHQVDGGGDRVERAEGTRACAVGKPADRQVEAFGVEGGARGVEKRKGERVGADVAHGERVGVEVELQLGGLAGRERLHCLGLADEPVIGERGDGGHALVGDRSGERAAAGHELEAFERGVGGVANAKFHVKRIVRADRLGQLERLDGGALALAHAHVGVDPLRSDLGVVRVGGHRQGVGGHRLRARRECQPRNREGGQRRACGPPHRGVALPASASARARLGILS